MKSDKKKYWLVTASKWMNGERIGQSIGVGLIHASCRRHAYQKMRERYLLVSNSDVFYDICPPSGLNAAHKIQYKKLLDEYKAH